MKHDQVIELVDFLYAQFPDHPRPSAANYELWTSAILSYDFWPAKQALTRILSRETDLRRPISPGSLVGELEGAKSSGVCALTDSEWCDTVAREEREGRVPVFTEIANNPRFSSYRFVRAAFAHKTGRFIRWKGLVFPEYVLSEA